MEGGRAKISVCEMDDGRSSSEGTKCSSFGRDDGLRENSRLPVGFVSIHSNFSINFGNLRIGNVEFGHVVRGRRGFLMESTKK